VKPWSRLLDGCYRQAFRLAYPIARRWWRLHGHQGVAIAVWSKDHVLLVRHSYKPGLHLPGGGMHAGEDHHSAAVRELHEELGVQLELKYVVTIQTCYGVLHLYEAEVSIEPALVIDHREIIYAAFLPVEFVVNKSETVMAYLRTRSIGAPGPLAKYLSPRPDYWTCAVCFSTQRNAEPCHCGISPALELTAYGAKEHEP
jgi:8-oxo-dGTP diphosphatase